jgi:integrase
MPRKAKKERVAGRYFHWLVGTRGNGVYYADGRSNPRDGGRHSLGTRDRREALQRLARLDLVRAVALGLADPTALDPAPPAALTLEEGRRLYLEYVRRPPVLGGVAPATHRRYRNQLGKFVAFCRRRGIATWQAVTKPQLEAYGVWLEERGHAYATQYVELTTVKQTLKWLAEEGHVPSACRFPLPLAKPQGTTTYCYTPQEVRAILDHCARRPELNWLGDALLALASTGLRIAELCQLRWCDVDLGANVLRLTDARRRAPRARRADAPATKSHRDRVLPLQAELRALLERLPRHADGRVFRGPGGRPLTPRQAFRALTQSVLKPLTKRFPAAAGQKGLAQGGLHSFRHYFCSVCASGGTPEQVLIRWLGHQDSKMVKRYYHLYDAEAQRQMAKLRFVPPRARARRNPAGPGRCPERQHRRGKEERRNQSANRERDDSP